MPPLLTLDDLRLSLRPTLASETAEAEVESRVAAVAAVLREHQRQVELLFIRRARRRGDPWSGHMAWPGGKREPADASAVACAVRETREECGCRATSRKAPRQRPSANPTSWGSHPQHSAILLLFLLTISWRRAAVLTHCVSCSSVALGLLTIAGLAHADVSVVFRVIDGRGRQTGTRTVAVRPNSLRMDDGSRSLIVNLAVGRLSLVDRAGKLLSEAKLADRTQRLAKLESGLARVAVRGGWAALVKGEPPFAVKVTGQRRKVLGYDTVRVELSRAGARLLEAWCAAAVSTRELLGIASVLGREPPATAWGQQPLAALWSRGFPLVIQNLQTGEKAEALSVSTSPVDEARFRAPSR